MDMGSDSRYLLQVMESKKTYFPTINLFIKLGSTEMYENGK